MYAFTICSRTSCVKLGVTRPARQCPPVGDVADHEGAARGVEVGEVDLEGFLQAALRVREGERGHVRGFFPAAAAHAEASRGEGRGRRR